MAAEKILIVEDDDSMRLLLNASLGTKGYRVKTANNGREALHTLGEDLPDLVITDAKMPDIDGFELTRRLRANSETARIPIIMLSSQDATGDILAGYGEGADEYILKTTPLEILAAKVEGHLRRARAVGGPPPRAPRGKVVLFLRGKGGAGATTLAVNAAVALASSGTHRVTLLDLNLEFGNTAMMLDVIPRRTLADLGAVSVSEIDDAFFAQFVGHHASGVRVVVGSESPETAELVTVPTVQQTLDRLRDQADYVLVDTPPGFSDVNLAVLDAAEVICLVTTPHLAALKATNDCLAVLRRLQVPNERVLLILNRTTPRGLDDGQVAEFFKRKPDVVIPYTERFDDAADAGRPFVTSQPTNAGAIKMRELAGRVASLAPGRG